MVLGVDLIEISRVERALTRFGDRFLERVFTPAEVLYSRGRLPELAARFAAKEAVLKALGVGWQNGVSFCDVEVCTNELGAPTVQLSGRARELSRGLGAKRFFVSLSHDARYAVAQVVAEA